MSTVPSSDSAFLSREELLGGLPARRASTLLFAIESYTARLVLRSRQALTHFLTQKTAEAQERAFLAALAQGRNPSAQVSIQDLERYAPQWTSLVPSDPRIRAALTRMIGDKYAFTEEVVPRLRRALGLDQDAIQQAYQRLYGRPIATIFSPQLTWRESLRWDRARMSQWLEDLSPFWTTFALTLTGTVGTTTLALPIAVAEVGPLAGVLVLLVLGLVNILTIAAMAEAVTRNGRMRYGNAYLGRLVADYLGGPGTAIFTLAVLLACAFALLVRYIGLTSILADGTGIPPLFWAVLLFLVNLYFLHRGTFGSTLASTLVIGVINVGLILILSLLALPHVRAANLLYLNVPFIDGQPFNPSQFELIFGVTLSVYARHISVGSCAKVVLGRDPSGHALLWGNVAALAAAMALYCLWVVAVNGAVGPQALIGFAGTALTPLAAESGPLIHICGTLFAILSMGMGSIYMSLILYHHVREWLPTPARGQVTSEHRFAGRFRGVTTFAGSDRGTFYLSIAPVVLIFLLIAWLLVTGHQSFTRPIAFVSAITGPVLGGIFPILTLAASRQKGEYIAQAIFRLLRHPVVIVGVYLFFVISIFVHGLVIWTDPMQQTIAVLVGIVMVSMNVIFVRQGAFRPQVIVELRAGQSMDGRGVFNVIERGKPWPVHVRFKYHNRERQIVAATGEIPAFAELYSIRFQLPESGGSEVKIWAHQITTEGKSEALAAHLEMRCGGETYRRDLSISIGRALLPHNGAPCQIELIFSNALRYVGHDPIGGQRA